MAAGRWDGTVLRTKLAVEQFGTQLKSWRPGQVVDFWPLHLIRTKRLKPNSITLAGSKLVGGRLRTMQL